MIAARRTRYSFALDHAIARAKELGRPLVVFEPLRAGYQWASDRHHQFVIDGMADNAAAFKRAGITYFSYVEPEPGAGKGLLAALAHDACLVVTDEQPGFFLGHMVAAAAAKLDVCVETVDGNGLLPMRFVDRAYPSAAHFRRAMQKLGPPHLATVPAANPLASIPRALRDAEIHVHRWKSASSIAEIPIDHGVAPVPYRGGAKAAHASLTEFVEERLPRYRERNHPDAHAASGLSPYLHFGHVGAHEVADTIWRAVDWTPAKLAPKPTGTREGWWGLPPAAEAFFDELVTWRELGYGYCFHRKDYATLATLPAWARDTLGAHASDPRPERYSHAELEAAATGDEIWNAAQRELVAEGRIQNYLRMLWGKKILEWTRSPRVALTTLIELNNKYAVDGRDPNSYSGILWTLGLFDRPWAERPIFGTVRYMSSAQARRKLDMSEYLARYGAPACDRAKAPEK
jgi:deoxyribodipyrimidine photo-lyase